MRVILDCNVLISAGLNAGTCRDLIDEVILKHQLFLSHSIIAEYERVIKRFELNPMATKIFGETVPAILEVATIVEPLESYFKLTDHDDEIYLATALSAKADVIITGNKKHFPFDEYKGVKILSPREFLDLRV
ncbi:MAG: putative toxin-antitoxin system toxin component, PIN family [Nitrospirae bacterium]|nr:putative toxin-antitoxin system toxin component, PIN family [Nitrospirota bacterium]